MFDDTQPCGGSWKSMLLVTSGVAAALGGGVLLGSAIGHSGAEAEWLISLPTIWSGAKALDVVDARPHLKVRLRNLLGGAGSAVADRACDDAAAGAFDARTSATDVTYRATWTDSRWRAEPVSGPTTAFARESTVRAKVPPNSTAFVTISEGGKLQTVDGTPPVVNMYAEDRIRSAACHDQGRQLDIWRLTDEAAPLTLDIEPSALAVELVGMADEVRDGGGQAWIANKLDRLSDAYRSLAEAGRRRMPVAMDHGLSSLDAL